MEPVNTAIVLQRSKTIKLIAVYFGWVSTHYAAAHLYPYICTPLSITGFITSAFNTVTPYCSALRWCIFQGADNIAVMWTLLGLWFAARQNQKIWFLLMGILQVVGIIEIIYLATQTRFFKNFNLND